MLFIHLESQDNSCRVNYSGPFAAISGAVKNVLEDSGFQELQVPATERPSLGGIYIKFSEDRTHREQFIIVENVDNQLLTVSFSIKAN